MWCHSGSGSLNNGDYIRYVYNYVLPRSRFSVSRVSEDLVGRGGCASAVWASWLITINWPQVNTTPLYTACFVSYTTAAASRSLLGNNTTMEQQCNSRSLLKSTTMLIRFYQQLTLSILPFSCSFTNINTLNLGVLIWI